MMNISWEPTKGNHYQARKGTDKDDNKYQMTANLEVVQCITPDGYVSSGWTAEEALAGASAKRDAAQIAGPQRLTTQKRHKVCVCDFPNRSATVSQREEMEGHYNETGGFCCPHHGNTCGRCHEYN